MSTKTAMNDAEIKFKGIDILNKTLGPTGALKFLTMFYHEPTDYVKISKKLYAKQSIDEIFKRAKKH